MTDSAPGPVNLPLNAKELLLGSIAPPALPSVTPRSVLPPPVTRSVPVPPKLPPPPRMRFDGAGGSANRTRYAAVADGRNAQDAGVIDGSGTRVSIVVSEHQRRSGEAVPINGQC